MSGDLHQGGCQCGAVRFAASGAPKFVAICHCTSCRKATGGAFSTWIGFAGGKVSWPKGEPAYYASSKGVRRGFCARCGTPLTYASERWPGETHFLIGAMDRPEAYTPTGEVFSAEALPWAQHLREFPL